MANWLTDWLTDWLPKKAQNGGKWFFQNFHLVILVKNKQILFVYEILAKSLDWIGRNRLKCEFLGEMAIFEPKKAQDEGKKIFSKLSLGNSIKRAKT